MKNAEKSNKTEHRKLGQRHGEPAKLAHPKLAWAIAREKILDARLGKGLGAIRERKRLQSIFSAS